MIATYEGREGARSRRGTGFVYLQRHFDERRILPQRWRAESRTRSRLPDIGGPQSGDLLFAETASAALLEDVRRTGTIAVVFSRPADHRTLQLKGKDALIVPVEAGDAELSSRQIEIFVEGL